MYTSTKIAAHSCVCTECKCTPMRSRDVVCTSFSIVRLEVCMSMEMCVCVCVCVCVLCRVVCVKLGMEEMKHLCRRYVCAFAVIRCLFLNQIHPCVFVHASTRCVHAAARRNHAGTFFFWQGELTKKKDIFRAVCDLYLCRRSISARIRKRSWPR